MSIRSKLLMIVGTIVLLIVIVLVFVFSVGRGKGEKENETERTVDAPTAAPIDIPVVTPEVRDAFTLPVTEPAPQDIAALARSFTERYGSFSNQSNFENIEELYPFMTASFQEKNERIVADGRAVADPKSAYIGFTTRALNVTVSSRNATDADIRVESQRRFIEGTTTPVTRYETLVLTLEKDGDAWKVADATWVASK